MSIEQDVRRPAPRRSRAQAQGRRNQPGTRAGTRDGGARGAARRGTGRARDPTAPFRCATEPAADSTRSRATPWSANWYSAQLALESRLEVGARRVLLFTSAMHEEGVTTLAIAYSRLLAMHAHERVLLDRGLNARHPAGERRRDQPGRRGSRTRFAVRALVQPRAPHVRATASTYCAWATPIRRRFRFISRRYSRACAKKPSRSCDTIIVDAPPVVLSPETPPLTRLCGRRDNGGIVRKDQTRDGAALDQVDRGSSTAASGRGVEPQTLLHPRLHLSPVVKAAGRGVVSPLSWSPTAAVDSP